MSYSKLFLAAALLTFAVPASAQVSPAISINGTLTITRTTILCTSSSALDCLFVNPGGQLVQTLTRPFNLGLTSFDIVSPLVEGDNFFAANNNATRTNYVGFINNSAGFLTGRDLQFTSQSCSGAFQGVGCFFETGAAASFNVVGGVPEPTTWAMMLMGFAAIGFSMRRRRRALAIQTV